MFAAPFSLAKPDAVSPIGVFPGEAGEAFANAAETKDFSSLLKGFVQLANLPCADGVAPPPPSTALAGPALPAGEQANPAAVCKAANCPGKILPPALPRVESAGLADPFELAEPVTRGVSADEAAAPDPAAIAPLAPEAVVALIAPVSIPVPVPVPMIAQPSPSAPAPDAPVAGSPADPAANGRPVQLPVARELPAAQPVAPVADNLIPVDGAISKPIAQMADGRPAQPATFVLTTVSSGAITQTVERSAHQDTEDHPAERSPQQSAPQPAPSGPTAKMAPAAADLPRPEFASDLPQQVQSASPVPAGTAGPHLSRPDDLVALVDRLAAARAALSPLEASLEVEHPDFGSVGLNFRQDRLGGLSVDVTTSDAELGQSVAAMAARAGTETGTGTQPDHHAQPQARGTGHERDAAETAHRGDQGRRASADDRPQRPGQADSHADAKESRPRAAPRGTFA